MRFTARSRWATVIGMTAVSVLALTACSSGSSSSESTAAASAPASEAPASAAPASSACTTPTPVKLQLQWFAQAQFAGYYAAKDKGYYKDQCLDVTIVEGGVDIVPQTQLAQGNVDYAISWVPKALASREQGAMITDVAQVFQRSGTLQVSWADSNIKTGADFKGKKIGNWGFGNEFEIFADLTKNNLDPAKDVTLVQQQFDMKGLLLEAKNAKTGKLNQPSDFNVVSYEAEGVGMLQDAIWANGDKLSDPAYQAQTQAFVTASLQGWIYCRDNAEDCAKIVTANGSKLGASHQLWMMNEVNKLIWPSPLGVGVADPKALAQTITIATGTKNLDGATVLTAQPDPAWYTDTYAKAADAALSAMGLNTTGDGYAPLTVTLMEGGN